MLDLAAVYDALERVVDPCSIATGVPLSLREMGMIKDVEIEDGAVHVLLRLTSPICWQAGLILERVREVVDVLPGVRSVTCTMDAGTEWLPDMMLPDARARLRRMRPVDAL